MRLLSADQENYEVKSRAMKAARTLIASSDELSLQLDDVCELTQLERAEVKQLFASPIDIYLEILADYLEQIAQRFKAQFESVREPKDIITAVEALVESSFQATLEDKAVNKVVEAHQQFEELDALWHNYRQTNARVATKKILALSPDSDEDEVYNAVVFVLHLWPVALADARRNPDNPGSYAREYSVLVRDRLFVFFNH